MYINLENDAHDVRRELLGAIGSLQSAIDSLKPYASLQWEDSATDGLVVNLTDLSGSVARDAAQAQLGIAKAVRYALKAATVVEPRLEAARVGFHADCNARTHCENHDNDGTPNGPVVWPK